MVLYRLNSLHLQNILKKRVEKKKRVELGARIGVLVREAGGKSAPPKFQRKWANSGIFQQNIQYFNKYYLGKMLKTY